jgi:hypothetical protein
MLVRLVCLYVGVLMCLFLCARYACVILVTCVSFLGVRTISHTSKKRHFYVCIMSVLIKTSHTIWPNIIRVPSINSTTTHLRNLKIMKYQTNKRFTRPINTSEQSQTLYMRLIFSVWSDTTHICVMILYLQVESKKSWLIFGISFF